MELITEEIMLLDDEQFVLLLVEKETKKEKDEAEKMWKSKDGQVKVTFSETTGKRTYYERSAGASNGGWRRTSRAELKRAHPEVRRIPKTVPHDERQGGARNIGIEIKNESSSPIYVGFYDSAGLFTGWLRKSGAARIQTKGGPEFLNGPIPANSEKYYRVLGPTFQYFTRQYVVIRPDDQFPGTLELANLGKTVKRIGFNVGWTRFRFLGDGTLRFESRVSTGEKNLAGGY